MASSGVEEVKMFEEERRDVGGEKLLVPSNANSFVGADVGSDNNAARAVMSNQYSGPNGVLLKAMVRDGSNAIDLSLSSKP